MSEPVLRRSGRNAAKKEVAPPPAPAAAAAPTRKRSSAEPKKPVPKKAKVKAAAATTVTEEAPAKNDEAAPASSSKATTAVAAVGTAATAAAKSAKAAVTSKTAKAKKAGEPAAESAPALGDGDVLPKDLPEVQTHDGSKTSLTALLEKAQKGIVIFAYPKAQTPGCTTQACLFRDKFAEFSNAGYTVFGLSGDTPASNEKFKTKQNLSYTLLCDPTFELHGRFGIKRQPKGTIRSIIVIEKSDDASFSPGKILKKAPASPQASLAIALQAVGIESGSAAAASGSTAAVATEENKVPDAASTAVDAVA